MITTLGICQHYGTDPYENLAIEKYLSEHVAPGQCILYLWQNKSTVVIGQNQNAWAECRIEALKDAGGKLARRLSGGGAVFHDLGNLNFTFSVNEEDYDLDRQTEVIRRACLLCGIAAEKSGRNDILADGRKFSGNAFYHSGGKAYHHGTLMVDVDMSMLGAYLSPPKAKLQAKGIASVRSRVVNLKELCPDLTVEKLRELMADAFCQVYGLPASPVTLDARAKAEIAATAARIGTFDYLCGKPMASDITCEEKFPWGYVQLCLEVKSGVITAVKVFTDAMEWNLSGEAELALAGCRFEYGALQSALSAVPHGEDILSVLKQQIL